jgi:hypothetical protein
LRGKGLASEFLRRFLLDGFFSIVFSYYDGEVDVRRTGDGPMRRLLFENRAALLVPASRGVGTRFSKLACRSATGGGSPTCMRVPGRSQGLVLRIGYCGSASDCLARLSEPKLALPVARCGQAALSVPLYPRDWPLRCSFFASSGPQVSTGRDLASACLQSGFAGSTLSRTLVSVRWM